MGKFSMKVNRMGKVYEGKVEGRMTVEDGMSFLETYNKDIKSFNPTEYTLKFDATELAISDPNSVKVLGDCYKLYKEAGFKEVVVLIKKNIPLKMQLERLARENGMKDIVKVTVIE